MVENGQSAAAAAAAIAERRAARETDAWCQEMRVDERERRLDVLGEIGLV
jgi:hypothetical protein